MKIYRKVDVLVKAGWRIAFFCLAINTAIAQKSEQPMKRYTVREGEHFSKPRLYKLKRNPSKVKWAIRFDSNCNYTIRDPDGQIGEDQKDWNKLCGVFFKVLSFNTRKESVMMGWRYNVEQNRVELAPYYHINAGRDMFAPMMTVELEELFWVTLTIDRENSIYKWTMEKPGFSTEHEMPFDHTSNT